MCEYVKFHFKNCCFAVAMSPTCSVDRAAIAADQYVTYNCSATRVCGNISLTIEEDGSTRDTGIDSVLWRVRAGDVANSTITCLSTVQCPSLNITSKFITLHLKARTLQTTDRQTTDDRQTRDRRQTSYHTWQFIIFTIFIITTFIFYHSFSLSF